ncbi:winged helix-turn-helix domain-containing protein [Thioalkalivibrio sp. XN279]|uniref:winged helix-turn-helix domain-containing protein n=1 Tax=Thioalkalivibrio sp. XN279 TaxID=2714953 RepID=UPI00140A72A2|nr:hypothetical protein [Thioalkalivibrio sp. XN279]
MGDRTDQGLDAGTRHAFLDFVLDPAREVLAGPDGEITLRPKSFAVLSYLLAHAGRVCTKDELLAAVWGQTVVTEDSLTQCLVEIRRALGDHDRSIIRTVPRRGYLLNAEVRRVGSGAAAVGGGSFIGGVPRASRLGFESVVAALLLVALMVFMGWRAVDAPEADEDPASIPVPADTTLPPFTAEEIAARGTTIAVLPFADMSPAGDHAYLGDGMAEEILNLLAEADGLRVIARTSSFSLRDARLDVRVIGRRLGASHILEGSVRPDGERVRVTAQLIDAEEGAHLWSETYDRPLGEVLALQDEIAASVAAQLRANLAREIDAGRSIDPQAYEHKLRGAYLFSRRREGDLETALQHFEAALALEPNYGAAWVGLAGARWVLMLEDDRMEPEELEAFREAALRGVELSPGMPEAHLRAAASYGIIGSAAMRERHMRIAMELDPDNPLLLGMLAGRAVRAGDLEEALDYQYRALRQDPLYLVTRGNLVSFLLAAGRIEQARLEFNTLVELGGERAAQEAHVLLLEGRYTEAWEIFRQPADDAAWIAGGAMALHALGREAEALEWIEPLRGKASHEAAFAVAEFEAWRGEVDAGLEWLEQARERLALLEPVPSIPSWKLLLTLSPYISPLRTDPRFAEIATIAP